MGLWPKYRRHGEESERSRLNWSEVRAWALIVAAISGFIWNEAVTKTNMSRDIKELQTAKTNELKGYESVLAEFSRRNEEVKTELKSLRTETMAGIERLDNKIEKIRDRVR
jgi:hypothetical protein